MTLRIVNQKIRGCPMCQNPRVSSVADPMIFSCESTVSDMLLNLEANGIYVDENMLRDHITHVFAVDDESDDAILNLKTDASGSNLDIVIDSLNKIIIIENNLLISGKGDTKEFMDLLKKKQEYITLKAKLEGELTENTTIMIPDWIQKVKSEPRVIDAEVIQKSLSKP